MKYVLVTGGVVSGSAKGVTAITVDLLLKACGLTPIKIDPYLNTDGGYVDLDLGSYERFLDITAGKIYQSFSQLVIAKESEGDYLGKTVQVVPHVTDAIQDWIERVAVIPVDGEEGPANVCVIQLGGTIGDDIESDPFIKALGQFSYRVGLWNFCWVHFSVVPVLNVVGERKLWGLRGLGLTPDILVCCLGAKALEENVKEKIAQSCHVPLEYVFALYDVSDIRHILLLLEDQKAHLAISKVLNFARDDDKHFVHERHPHHIYEVNPEMVERQEKADLSLAAKDEIGKRIEPVDNLRSPMNEQENCSDYRPKKSPHTRRTIPSKPKVKEKTQKKGNFITEEAMKRNHKNPPYIYLINTIIVLLGLIIYITSVSSDMATRFSSIAGRRSTNYSSLSPRFDAVSSPSFSDVQANSNLTPSPVSYPMRIAVSPGKVHQVFLNFRGEQLRYNFVTHVSDALQRHEIKFFIDKYEQRGNDLNHLFVRIEESSIALAIFSTRYPESSWCMDELVKMKKLADQGKLRVIPIFYKVEAEDVNKPTPDSEFGRNFWRLAVSNGDKIKAWMEALECISEKMGLSLGEKSSESDFVYEIVMELKRVKEAIELEEEEKSFLGKKLKRKVGNFNYLFNYIGVVRLFIHRDVRTK